MHIFLSLTITHLNPLEAAVDEVSVENVLVSRRGQPVVVHEVNQVRQLPVDVSHLIFCFSLVHCLQKLKRSLWRSFVIVIGRYVQTAKPTTALVCFLAIVFNTRKFLLPLLCCPKSIHTPRAYT